MSDKSDAEDTLAFQLRAVNIPTVRQFKYSPDRKFAADFCIPHAMLLIEVQGGIHSFRRTRKDGTEYEGPGAHGSVSGILKDNERLLEAMVNGYKLIRVTPQQVTDGVALQQIERVLGVKA